MTNPSNDPLAYSLQREIEDAQYYAEQQHKAGDEPGVRYWGRELKRLCRKQYTQAN